MRTSLLCTLAALAASAACGDSSGPARDEIVTITVSQPAVPSLVGSGPDFAIVFDRVRVTLRRADDTTRVVRDTTIVFGPSTPRLTIDILVRVSLTGERFDARLSFLNGSQAMFTGHGLVTSHPAGSAPPQSGAILITYAGPGSSVASIAIAPRNPTMATNEHLNLLVTARDSAGTFVPAPPILWSSSDVSLAAVSASGVLQVFQRAGRAVVTAFTPTGVRDSTVVTIVQPVSAP